MTNLAEKREKHCSDLHAPPWGNILGNNTELRHLKGPKKDQTLSEIIDTLRRSKKSNRCFPPRRETSVHPTAWTLIGRQAL